MTTELGTEAANVKWLTDRFAALTTRWDARSPSEWAEARRRLPASVTTLPGPFRFEIAPFMREIVDCLSIDSPIREVTLMKGVQITATTAVLENVIGYAIDEVRQAPCMMVTADADLAKIRLTQYIVPMLQSSGLSHLITSSDTENTRKRGLTDQKVEWVGGGFLIPFGAQNANKLRSIPIQFLLRDEIDGWPDVVGKDGDPMRLSADRTAAFEGKRKILDISTPLIKGTSKIERRFLRGDQRFYHVRCLKCEAPQVLRWKHAPNANGAVGGMVWETENGTVAPDSVRYLCQQCLHPHTNEDKVRLLAPEHGAFWKPTNPTPADPFHRSYHLSALYSPVGMQSWGACVAKWLDAWDTEHNRVRDVGQLQVFYNNVLGETFAVMGERVRFEHVNPHRRQYHYGSVPNELAVKATGGPVLLLTCSVDVHKDNLAVAVFGWTRGRRAFLIDYQRFEGDTEQLDNPNTWGKLRDWIENREYKADDGKLYKIRLTLVDSGYRADDVYQFVSEYQYGVFPVKGRSAPITSTTLREFSDFRTPMGTLAFGVTVDFYKDRWGAALRRSWDGLSRQPEGHFNAPVDATDDQLKELTREVRRVKRDKETNLTLGHEWHRPSGAPNELWDCLVYANAALDIIAWDTCMRQLEMEQVNMTAFYDLCESQPLFFSQAPKQE